MKRETILKPKRPFRVLVLDDDIHSSVRPLLTSGKHDANVAYYFLTALTESYRSLPQENRADIELLWSQSVDFSQKVMNGGAGGHPTRAHTFFRIFPPANAGEKTETVDYQDSKPVTAVMDSIPGENVEAFLKSVDVLILDLSKLHGEPPAVTVENVRTNFEHAGVALQAEVDIEAHLKSSRSNYQGLLFYHAYRRTLSDCQFVAILSAYDDKRDKSQAPVNDLLHPLCGLSDEQRPFTVKYGKHQVQTEGRHSSLHTRIVSMYLDYCEGYTQLRHLGQIEQAANHDFPVMIVGESGTGKEYVARAIHRRWMAEKRRTISNLKDTFVVVNCAGLSSELARTELFGHVAGSFTGATDHRLGAILRACGCEGFKSKKRNPEDIRADSEAYKQFQDLMTDIAKLDSLGNEAEKVQRIITGIKPKLDAILVSDFRSLLTFFRNINAQLLASLSGADLVTDYWRKLLGTNGDVMEEMKGADGKTEELGVRFKSKVPVGTLFLDEFGDLPPEVQNLLLRFLEEKSGEIQPVGYPGRIAGIKIRLILATSDPRIAKFAGYNLSGTHRSDQELKRSLRHDLLFRVKGQVVKTEAIESQEQLTKSLDEMVERHSIYVWDIDAKDYLSGKEGKITKIIERFSTKRSGKESENCEAVVFGQRRELKRIIDLANAYMESAERRGLRLDSDLVTGRIIQEIWRPSQLLMTKPTEHDVKQPQQDLELEHSAKEEIERWLKSNNVQLGKLDYKSLLAAIPEAKYESFLAFVSEKFTGANLNPSGFKAVMSKGLKKTVPINTIRSAFTNKLKGKKKETQKREK